MNMVGYYVICIQSYEIDGIQCKEGEIGWHGSIRPIIGTKWRKATEEEVLKIKESYHEK
jgi:hypothetical protein